MKTQIIIKIGADTSRKKCLAVLTRNIIFSCLILFSFLCTLKGQLPPELHLTSLPVHWDEGIPLGNGMLGALVYQRDGQLRISLDCAALWDLRPIQSFRRKDFTYQWLYGQVSTNDYRQVQAFLDAADINSKAPTKIPAAALEFPIMSLGKIASVDLDIRHATCYIRWHNGAKAKIFVSACKQLGYFKFENLPVAGVSLRPALRTPAYNPVGDKTPGGASTDKQLSGLGYAQGIVDSTSHHIFFHQNGWGDFSYDVCVSWKQLGKHMLAGVWNIVPQGGPYSVSALFGEKLPEKIIDSMDGDWNKHCKWWQSYWKQSEVQIPDSVLQHQYMMGTYLFASASRKGAPPVSLQAVWTADNGQLPPWTGDYHNDLNTQLSYWPGYEGNHLAESSVFTDWLWKVMPVARKFTERFFRDSGLNFPGIAILDGEPRGKWAQYTFSPTTSCWLAQYFYWQWIYSGDTCFLRQRAFLWIREAIKHIESIAIKDDNGNLNLPISSSPEYNDNRIDAWYLRSSNYDLSLIRWLLRTGIQMADTLQEPDLAARWRTDLGHWPELTLNKDDSALAIAPGVPYDHSHRHLSSLMGIYPLQILDWYNGPADRKIIEASLGELKKYGPSGWTGFTYVWEACLQAMKQDGSAAARELQIFATSFCSSNTFHLNGDQSGKGYSGLKYRPFTLEANFAFLQAVQLMLLQQHGGINYIFPAIPSKWKQVHFRGLRAPGAFLLSSTIENGQVRSLQITSLMGGVFKFKNPFHRKVLVTGEGAIRRKREEDIISLSFTPGQTMMIQ